MRRLARLAYWMDDRFVIPGTGWRFGLDSVVGLLPGVGDTVGAAVSSYIIREAYRLGVPQRLITRMAWNVGLDFLGGLVPGVGDVLDVAYKANRRNIRLIFRHFDRPPPI